MNAIVVNIKTTILGFLVLLCTGTTFAGVLPDKWNALLQLLCGVLTAFGLIAAKDANVSNAPVPKATGATVT